MVSKQEQENKLALIPKSEKYIEYMLDVMIKLQRTEKFSIGTEYKQSMYKMLNKVMILNKTKNINNEKEIISTLNEIDAELNTQRIYLRIMKKYRWIDEKKFKVSMELIYEIGKILGGLIKYYAKNNIITIDVTGNGFLYNMVRIIVGTLVYTGEGRLDPDDMPDIIRSAI